MDKALLANLRAAYNGKAAWRDRLQIRDWKVEERGHFLAYLQRESKNSLLEIGAGPGQDSLFFQQQGMDVVATDLSPEMVRLCQEKGLTAFEMDFDQLHFAQQFEAIYALNCLLHVPKPDLPAILQRLQNLLQPDGLFYMGVYGGEDWQGIYEEDQHEPKRFFSFYTNEHIQRVVGQFFSLVYFKEIAVPDSGQDFQSMIWRYS